MRHSLPIALALGIGACAHGPTPVPTPAETPEPIAPALPGHAELTPIVEVNSSPVVYEVALVADLNGRYGSTSYGDDVHRAVERIVATSPDLVLSAGDMVAGQRADLPYRAMWGAFHAAVTDPLAQAGIPLAVTVGNHDGSGFSRFAEEREIFIDEWTARRPEVTFVDDTHYPLYYAFEAGGALFVSLDDTVPGGLSSEQHEWLDGLLSRADHAHTVVFGHLPLLPFADGKEDEALNDLELLALLDTHDVDFFVSGHHQAYYVGARDGVGLLGLGCLGGGPRELIGQEEDGGQSYATLRFHEDGSTSVVGHTGRHFDETIPLASLPKDLGAAPYDMDRYDLGITTPAAPPTVPGQRVLRRDAYVSHPM